MKKFIFIPVVNNFDLLEKAVRSVKPGLYDEYIIFNNSEQELPVFIYRGTQFRVWNPEKRMTFRETQNIMRSYAIDNQYDYYSFMHNDGEINDDSDIKLIEMAESLQEPWGAIFTHYDVFCAFNTNAVNTIGEWGDPLWSKEQQSGYYLDNDYYRRLEKNGYKQMQIMGCQVSHFASNTIKSPEEHKKWEAQQQPVLDHYRKKWGDLPPNEKYEIPFNGESE